jgi:hypothetical protein
VDSFNNKKDIWVCGHNYNKEIGDFNSEIIEKFVTLGYNYKEDTDSNVLSIKCGNGLLAIQFDK